MQGELIGGVVGAAARRRWWGRAFALAYWRLPGRVLAGRLVLLAVMAVLLVAVAPLAPVWPLVVVAGVLFAIVAAEGVAAPESAVGRADSEQTRRTAGRERA